MATQVKDNETTKPGANTQGAPETPTTEQPALRKPVKPETPRAVFDQYRYGADVSDPLDARRLLKDDVDKAAFMDVFECVWKRREQLIDLGKWKQRLVQRDTDGEWFKAEAFSVDGLITEGDDGRGKPELYLTIRDREYAKQEAEQMQELSKKRNNPELNADVKGGVGDMHAALAADGGRVVDSSTRFTTTEAAGRWGNVVSK